MTNDEIIKVVQAHSEGKTIQVRILEFTGRWGDVPAWGDNQSPEWNFCFFEYRIRPAAPRTRYLLEYPDGSLGRRSYDSTDGVSQGLSTNEAVGWVKFKEAIE